MFFDEVTLKRNGWYNKLFRFVYPRAPQFTNFCPFFWLTILALFLCPFVAMWKGILKTGRGCKTLAMGVGELLEKFVGDPLILYMYNRYGVEEFALGKSIWEREHWDRERVLAPKCEKKRYLGIWSWALSHRNKLSELGINLDQEMGKISPEEKKKRLELLREQYLADQIEEQKKAEKSWRRERERIELAEKVKSFNYTPLIKLGKIIGYVFGAILLILAIPLIGIFLYYIVLAIGWAWYWLWVGIWYMGQWSWGTIGEVFALIVVSSLVGVGFMLLVGKMIECPRCRNFFCKLGDWVGEGASHLGAGFLHCLTPIFWIGKGIVAFFQFIWMMLKTFKTNNCPGIKWE